MKQETTCIVASKLISESFETLLKTQGIERLFPVQELVLPVLFDDNNRIDVWPPRDICVSAPTGSGKTLCYVLPIIHGLKSRHDSTVHALIVVPVANLAKQVVDVFNVFSQGSDLRIALLSGKQNFERESNILKDGVDIVVATPGRLLEHLRMNASKFSLKRLRYLVMDEADRLMNDFRLDWLLEVEEAVYDDDRLTTADSSNEFNLQRRKIQCGNFRQLIAAGRNPLQKILLSATLSHNPEQLKQLNLFMPKYFSVDANGKLDNNFESVSGFDVPKELEELYVKCESNLKPLLVFQLIEKHDDWKKIFCFVSKRESSRRLAHVLRFMGIKTVFEATSKSNKFRMERILKNLQRSEKSVLVCSDLMARGIDVENVDCVINYDAPKFIRTYVHRVGRTARAENKGVALTVASTKEMDVFKKIMDERSHFAKLKEVNVENDEIEPLKEKYREALKHLEQTTVNETMVSLKRIKGRKRAHNEAFRKKKFNN